jgi:response regulator NasT
VAEAADGLQACEISLQLRPQVIIMDVQMPRRDGVEACRKIRRDRPEAQVILYTMHDPGPYRDPAVAPAEACMAKQDLFDQLLPTLCRLVERNLFRSQMEGEPR